MTRRMQLKIVGLVVLAGMEMCGAIGEAKAAPQNEKMPRTPKMGKASGSLSKTDKKFVITAAQGGMAEVELGQLAAKKGASDGVKQFGEKMVQDHSAANAELKQVASSKGITLPADVGAKHKAVIAKLSKLNGAAFDSAYIKDMVKDHAEDVKEFTKASNSASDADVKGFASKTLPVIKEHYQMITAMQGNKGKMNGSKMHRMNSMNKTGKM